MDTLSEPEGPFGKDDIPEHHVSGLERWRLIRDIGVCLLGGIGFLHELIVGAGISERPVILGVCAGMMGLGRIAELLRTSRGEGDSNG